MHDIDVDALAHSIEDDKWAGAEVNEHAIDDALEVIQDKCVVMGWRWYIFEF